MPKNYDNYKKQSKSSNELQDSFIKNKPSTLDIEMKHSLANEMICVLSNAHDCLNQLNKKLQRSLGKLENFALNDKPNLLETLPKRKLTVGSWNL